MAKYPVALHSLISKRKHKLRTVAFFYNGKPRLGVIVGGEVDPKSDNGAYVTCEVREGRRNKIKSFSLREMETIPTIS